MVIKNADSVLNQRILAEIEMEEEVRKETVGKWHSGIPEKRRKKVIFGPNVENLALNARMACGHLNLCCDGGIPDDFFTNNSRYRKKGSFISE